MAVNGSNYFTVTVQSSQVDADLTDYVVYVRGSDLPSGHGVWTNAKSDGADFRATKDGDSKTEVPFELKDFDNVGKDFELHIKGTGTLSSTSNTEYRVYYNSTDTAYASTATFGSENVWTAYTAVYHMDQDPSGTAPQILDSTSGGYDLTSSGTMTSGDLVSGKIGNGIDFDGSDDFLSGSWGQITGSQNRTISAWINGGTFSDGDTIAGWGDSTASGERYNFRIDTGSNLLRTEVNGGGFITGSTSLSTGTDYHVASVLDGTNVTDVTHYLNGSAETVGSSGAVAISTISGDLVIGERSDTSQGDRYFDGLIDEVRIAASALSADIISTEYNNQSSPSTFYALSAEQSVSGGTDVVLTSDTANLFSHDVYFEIDIQDSASATYDIDLIDMGKLKYSFDIPNSGEDVTAVGIKSGAIDVQFDNYIDGTDTLIDLLDSSFAYDSNQTWLGKMFFKLKSAGSYDNPILFEFTPKEVEFDEVSQICSISFIPRQRVGLTAVDVCDEAESEVYTYTIDRTALIDPAANDNIAYVARDYIRHALYQGYAETTAYPISGVTIEIDSGIFTSTGTALRVTGEEWFVTYQSVISGTPTTIPYTDDALVLLGTLASLEGAIYGTALGNLFYIARSDLDNSVTLDTDNIVKLKQDFFVEAEYRQLNLTQVDYADEDINVIAFSKNTFAEKNINIRLDPPLLIKGDITTSGQADQIADDNTILLEAVSNYQPAFSFDNEKKVSLTYWGIDGVFPYSVINFDTNAPEFVKNRDFRIKNIEYDFKADKFEAEMYEI